MAVVYFDASAFVKLLVEEKGSDLAAELWDTCDAPVSSRLSYPEVRAALAAAHRNCRLEASDLEASERQWEDYWSSVRAVELIEPVAQRAGELVRDHALRGADGVHLASALALDMPDLVFAVWDARLNDGAKAAGLRVAPAQL
jgi:uncharacterized protein